MSTKVIMGREVIRPTTTPLPSSILDHATVGPDVASFGMANNAGLWPSYNCMDTLNSTALCDEDPDMKTFGFGGWTPAFEFVYYGGVQCSNVGLDDGDMISEVRRVFLLNEGKGIEQGLLDTRFAAQVGDNTPVGGGDWDAPTDLGTAPSLLAGIGMLEGWAAAHYAGIPTLHLPRAVITMGFGLGAFVERDGKFYTKAGSKVAAGGGYDDLSVPISGTMELFATGEVYIEKSEMVDVNAFVLAGDGLNTETDSGNDFTDNSRVALAERMYRVAVDCFAANVTATVWS